MPDVTSLDQLPLLILVIQQSSQTQCTVGWHHWQALQGWRVVIVGLLAKVGTQGKFLSRIKGKWLLKHCIVF
jgi:hypothetical protein